MAPPQDRRVGAVKRVPTGFWARFLTVQTARFVLALTSLGLAGAGAFTLLAPETQGERNSEAAIFAVGQLFGLAALAFGHYFTTAARADRPQETLVVNPPDDPVHAQIDGEPQ